MINFLSYSEVHPRAYRTLAVYKNALRLPLLFKLGINIDTPLVYHYMRGLWAIIVPSVKTDRMPKWDFNQLLLWWASSGVALRVCRGHRLSQCRKAGGGERGLYVSLLRETPSLAVPGPVRRVLDSPQSLSQTTNSQVSVLPERFGSLLTLES